MRLHSSQKVVVSTIYTQHAQIYTDNFFTKNMIAKDSKITVKLQRRNELASILATNSKGCPSRVHLLW